MTSRKVSIAIIALMISLFFPLAGCSAGEKIPLNNNQIPIRLPFYRNFNTLPYFRGLMRPFVFRTDFLDQRAVKFFKSRAGIVLDTPGGLVHFNKYGWLQFDSVFTARLPGNMISDPSITDTGLRLRHFKEANSQLYERILKDPEFAKKFTQKEIDYIASNVKAGTGKPPIGYTWHHDRITGQLRLVPRNQHKHIFHYGGVEYWAHFTPKQVLFTSIKRWAKIALADWVLSVGYSTVKNTLDVNELKKTTTGVFGAWMSASFVETTMNLIPRLVPFKWLPPLMTFQPAAWAAGVTYFITRFAISKLWDEHEIEQAGRVEIACLAAESRARWAKISRNVLANNNTLKEISREIAEW